MAGQVNVGGTESVTTTLKAHDLKFPALSVAEQLTVVVPSPKVLLDGTQPELAMPLLSTAEKEYETLTAGTVPALGLTASGDPTE